MQLVNGLALRIATALAIGLLIGAERERRKGRGPLRAPAGIRTFAVTCLLGAVSLEVGGRILLAVVAASIAGLVTVSYIRTRQQDPGMTSEAALILTLLLGAPGYAAAGPGFGARGCGCDPSRRSLAHAPLRAIRTERKRIARCTNLRRSRGRRAAAHSQPLHGTLRRDQPADNLEDRGPHDVG